MATAIETPEVQENLTEEQFGEQLKSQTVAIRMKMRKIGINRKLSESQREKAAKEFGCDVEYFHARKRLFDIKNEKYKAVTAIQSQAASHLWWNTTPHPEKGIRLLHVDKVDKMVGVLTGYVSDLDKAVAELDKEYAALVEEAKKRLDQLFNQADYPSTVVGCFSITWDWPSLDPPDDLKKLNPKLWEQMRQQRIKEFDLAVGQAEQMFVTQLHEMSSHLAERLTGVNKHGKPNTFTESTVENLRKFFSRFKALSIGSNPEITKLVDDTEKKLGLSSAKALRSNTNLRASVGTAMKAIAANADKLIVKKKKRAFKTDESEA